MKSPRWTEITPSEYAWEREALVFEHDPDAERLDRFLERRNADGLDLPARPDLLRQLAETLKYAHEHRLYHRALTPQKVLVTDANAERPRLKIFDRRVGEHAAPLGSNTSGSRVSGALSTPGLPGDDEGDIYLAPETAHGQFIAEKLDGFSLGAIGFRLGRAGTIRRPRRHGQSHA